MSSEGELEDERALRRGSQGDTWEGLMVQENTFERRKLTLMVTATGNVCCIL